MLNNLNIMDLPAVQFEDLPEYGVRLIRHS